MEEEGSESDSSRSSENEENSKRKNTTNSWEDSSSSSSSGEEEEEEEEIEDSDQRDPQNEDLSDGNVSNSSNDDTINPTNTKKSKNVWDENPEIYGIRRSNRSRKEPQRLNIESESSSSSNESDDNRKNRKASDSWVPTLSDSESEESDSSFEPSQRRKISQKSARSAQRRGKQTNKKKQGGKPKAALRSKLNKVSYKESSEDETDSDDIIEQDENEALYDEQQEEVETIEKIMRHRVGRVGETGAQTTIYALEVEELASRGEPDPSKDDVETQFLIKWNCWSHLHNTWESKDTLLTQKCKGMKKLDNYIKRMNEINQWKQSASAEDVEYFECQLEMNEEIQKQYQQVERIVAHVFSTESNSSYPDYLCKWQGLPYSECTWEDGSLTARFFQSHIDEYLERERSDTIPNRNAKCLRHRPKFVAFKKQPSYMGSDELQLRDYQLDGINWLAHAWCKDTSVILSDEMGLGKTIQTISFLSYLFNAHRVYGPFLIVVPLSTMDSWQREFSLWGPAMNLIVYIGDVNSRTAIQEHEWCIKKSKKLKFNVILTTYEMLLRDKELLGSLYWACLVVDEAHRLKNDDSLLYRVLIEFRTNFRLLITGTPLQNSLKELWSLMHFIMPEKFDSWEDFESEYSISDKEGLQKLHRDLEPFLLRRVKKDVEKSLPAKVEQILRVEMSVIQKQYYRLILTKNVKELCKELKGSFSGLLNIIVELKKCCNHSTLIKPLDPSVPDSNILQTIIRGSGKMILLDKLLSRLKERGHRVLIFSQMVRMLDVIADYLALRRLQFQRLDGSIRGEQRKRAIAHFNAEGSQDFCFLLSTRAGGLGINLASADTVIIFDSDWNPQNDLQAMARAHRIGQKNQVNIYRFVTKNTIEEDIIERAKKKMVLDHLIIQRMDTTGRRILSKGGPSAKNPFNKEELSSILKFGAEELFKEHDQEADQKLQAMDIDEILQRAETQDTGDGANSMGEELLSQFKVVNYAAFDEEEIKPEPTQPQQPSVNPVQKLWEEIIPEEERKKAEEEAAEEERKAVEATLKPRSRKAVEKMNIEMKSSSGKKFKSKAFVDTDSSSDESIEETEEPESKPEKKKTSKKSRETTKEGVKGFTDAELRRFIKSYKKFARPSTRLDSIAEDAELTDKSAVELIELTEYLKLSCQQAVDEYHQKLVQDEQFDGKKKGATLKIGGVSINAPSVLKAEVDLEPLALCLPSENDLQKTYRLTVPTRSVHWGVSWGVKEDSMLLIGMLVHGVGNWEAIKNDQQLGLTSQILPVGNGKPQEKHLQSRADYLLKVLREQSDNQKDGITKETKKKKSRKKTGRQTSPVNAGEKETAAHVETENSDNTEKKKKTKKEKRKKKTEQTSKKSSKGGITPQDGVIVKDLREMDGSIFKKCKEKLRPEKKSLQLLQNPDEKASQEEQVDSTKRCLLKIGDHIEKCLDEYRQHEDELNSWRSYLWSFVARFTELTPSKLYRLYRTACRKRDEQREEEKKEIQKMKSNYTNTLHEIGKVIPPDRLELEEARKKALGLDSKSPAKIPKIDRLKIPHKKKEDLKPPAYANTQSSTTLESRDQSRLTTDPSKFRVSYSRDHKNGHHRHHTSNDHHKKLEKQRPSYSSSKDTSIAKSHDSSGGELKYKTYREWKESQLQKHSEDKQDNRQSHKRDEKPPSHYQKTPRDEKPPLHYHKAYNEQKHHSSFDNRTKQNFSKEQYEREPGEYVSPTYSNSPSSNIISPQYRTTGELSTNRKRTSSNNSGDHVVTHKKPLWDSDSNQSWSSGRGVYK